MAVKDADDEFFREIIKAIIPSLNGHDPDKLVQVDYGVDRLADNKLYGRKVMANIRYLILLYVAGRLELFRTFGLQEDNNTYFSAQDLKRVAINKCFQPEQIIFERSRAIENHYLPRVKDGMVIHIQREVRKKKDSSKPILTDLVALTEKGKESCERIVEGLLATIPEQKRPKPKLSKNVVPTDQAGNNDKDFEKDCQSFGLNWLRHDYFEYHKSTEIDFDNWKNGFEFDLPSIKAHKELRREALIADIKSKLENEGKLLIVGQSGSSKTTVLKELMCDYFDAGYEVLYNYGMRDIRNVDGLVNFIEDILRKDKKILVAIDNVHKEKTYSIFYFIDKVSNSQLAKKLKIIITARKPEIDWLLSGLHKVEEEIRKSIRKLCADPNFIYQLPYFNKEETNEFIQRYSGAVDQKLTDKITEIYNDTKGDPILVKFSVFSRGLNKMSKRCLIVILCLHKK